MIHRARAPPKLDLCRHNFFVGTFAACHRNGFKKWIKVNKPIFRGLIETHVKQSKRQKFVNNLLPGWFFEDNYGFSNLGKIWILWHPSVSVTVVHKSLQMVTCEEVTIPGHTAFSPLLSMHQLP